MQNERAARAMVDSVRRGSPVAKIIKEALDAVEDKFAALVGLALAAVSTALEGLGFVKGDQTDFESGSVTVFTSTSAEDPATTARLYVATGADGAVKLVQQDGTPNLDAEGLKTAVDQIGKSLGLVRPAGSTAQPPSGGIGVVSGQ